VHPTCRRWQGVLLLLQLRPTAVDLRLLSRILDKIRSARDAEKRRASYGQRRRRGSDGMRLAGAVLALVWGWATLVWMRKREYL